ncbi:hypothetical protein PUN28_006789 [Cardiocondyla obscurior]|uniref:Uncharacterized protein n=1 Tax=Cardiocondyla obscurior TaxID=286306 RepID=A0AAW2G240_9HYME
MGFMTQATRPMRYVRKGKIARRGIKSPKKVLRAFPEKPWYSSRPCTVKNSTFVGVYKVTISLRSALISFTFYLFYASAVNNFRCLLIN